MEMPPFSEVRNSNNRNRDMRLDIDNMSYEVSLINQSYHLEYQLY